MELFALAIIVGISGGIAARLTPPKGWTMYTLTAALVTNGFIGLFSPINALLWVMHIQKGEGGTVLAQGESPNPWIELATSPTPDKRAL